MPNTRSSLKRRYTVHGTGSEQELLIPVVKAIQATQTNTPLIANTSLITADAGYHSEA